MPKVIKRLIPIVEDGKIIGDMPVSISEQCAVCRNWTEALKCKQYPNGIPLEIINGKSCSYVVSKSRIPLVLYNLEKGRKPLPEGTIREYGGIKFKKMGGKWVYAGMGGRAAVSEEERQSAIQKELDELVPPTAIIEKIKKNPHYSVTKEDYLEYFQYTYEKYILDCKMLDPKPIESFLKYMGIKSFDDLLSYGSVQFRNKYVDWSRQEGKSLWQPGTEETPQYEIPANKVIESIGYFVEKYAEAEAIGRMEPGETLKIHIGSSYTAGNIYGTCEADGYVVRYEGSRGGVVDIKIPYPVVKEFVRHRVNWYGGRMKKKDKEYFDRVWGEIEASKEYRNWMADHNPRVRKAVRDFEVAVGIPLEITAFMNAATTSASKAEPLKADNIRKVQALFEDLRTHFDFSGLSVPEEHKLKVRITGMGQHNAGFYCQDTINISPELPGAITHELGHYLWERGGKALEDDFQAWVESSGFKERLEEGLQAKPAQEKMRQSIVVEGSELSYFHGKVGKELEGSDAFKALTSIEQDALRQHFSLLAKFHGDYFASRLGEVDWFPHDLFRLRDFTPEQLDVVAREIAVSDYAGGRAAGDILAALTISQGLLREGDLAQISEDLGKTYYETLKITKMMYSTGMIEPTYRYHQKADYFTTPTEMFARSFRQYFAMKDGLKEWADDSEMDSWDIEIRQESSRQRGTIHGLPFPNVDPTYDMIRNGFESLLKKHFGNSVLKSLDAKLRWILGK